MSNKAPSISLPQGGGAMEGMGEKFSADLFTGTGNFSVPIAVPQGRNGLSPSLSLGYSTGGGNTPFGLGWNLGVPGVMRKMDQGIPVYDDKSDVFILSGAEDLVPISIDPLLDSSQKVAGSITRYRPRTEGLFARIDHIVGRTAGDYWKVVTKDGSISYYGTPNAPNGQDKCVLADPKDSTKILEWRLSKTEDLFGNQVSYRYQLHLGKKEPHVFAQLYLSEILYGDYGDPQQPEYMFRVLFNYENRPDPFSSYKQGFEVRTEWRCQSIQTFTNATEELLVKTYHFTFMDEVTVKSQLPLNKASMLAHIQIQGHDGEATEWMPPLKFGYSTFEPKKRKFKRVDGPIPRAGLSAPNLELVDLTGNGLPDLLEMDGSVRWYRNMGQGRFDRSREMAEAPLGLRLGDDGVQLMDTNGDGRVDLVVNRPGLSGYFSTSFAGGWDKNYFHAYEQVPTFSLADPNVKLIDLDGDGVTDAMRIGDGVLQCFYGDRKLGFYKTEVKPLADLDGAGNINFSDPRMMLADMSGDGMQDIVFIQGNSVSYWPNLGYGRFGKRVVMRGGLDLPSDMDPRRLLIGDIDGDGCADLVYVDNGRMYLWINQTGNAWSERILMQGTPNVSDMDSVRLTDLTGSGTGGILWTGYPDASENGSYYLDFAEGNKPYLMQEMDNQMGSITRVEYKSSLEYYLEDEKNPATRWRTQLPFPVLVVAKVEVIDAISQGKLTTEYRYHHGYWDGYEREFRGFGRVDQIDTETFQRFNAKGLQESKPFKGVAPTSYCPPIMTKNWFHLGPLGVEEGGFYEADFSDEYWQYDPVGLQRPASVKTWLQSLNIWDRRDAIRTLRGTALRSEVYALDGSSGQARPYTVTEGISCVRQEQADLNLALQTSIELNRGRRPYKIFFPYGHSQRSTQWERGYEPMTNLSLSGTYDAFGQVLQNASVAVPRHHDWRKGTGSTEPYLATASNLAYIYAMEGNKYMCDRVLYTKAWDGTGESNVPALAYLEELIVKAQNESFANSDIIGHTINYYDGPEYVGESYGVLGNFGALVRTETLMVTQAILTSAYGGNIPPCFSGTSDPDWTGYPADFVSGLQSPECGYVYKNAAPYIATSYYASPSATKYDFQTSVPHPRGLVVASMDTFGAESTIAYDEYDLMPLSTTDALGMTTSAVYDYRVMQPSMVTDPNGNRSLAAFTPLGMLFKTAIQGKVGEDKGDTLEHPTSWLTYDFFNYAYNGKPIWVQTTVRERHWYDYPYDDVPTQTKVDYSDGFGRLLQSRVQAEDVIFGDSHLGDSGLPASQSASNQDAVGVERESTDPLNVIVSGWQVYNNKGAVVEKYEPFYDKGFDYQPPSKIYYGRKVQMFYDPRGQVIRTLNPDGTEQKVIYGRPVNDANPNNFVATPWETTNYDANDLKASNALSFGTPKHGTIDAMGRVIETFELNRYTIPGTPPTIGEQEIRMRFTYDIRGNLLTIHNGITVGGVYSFRPAFTYNYDLKPKEGEGENEKGANVLRTCHLDSGHTYLLTDTLGKPVTTRDDKGAITASNYDALNRPTMVWAKDKTGEDYTLRMLTQYGDNSGLTDPQDENLKGKVWRQYDEAGRVESPSYDFKGNPLHAIRRVIKVSEVLSIFTGPPDWDNLPAYRVNWDGGTLPDTTLLDSVDYRTDTEYDALNRPTQITYPAATVTGDSNRRVMVPSYNKAGALDRVDLKDHASASPVNYVERIAYNAQNQRILLALGNGLMTRYAYDPRNSRLFRLKTEKYVLDHTGQEYTYEPQSGTVKQDYAYSFDSLGNILSINDETPEGGVGGSTGLTRNFEYDALYRLLKATGRENSPYNASVYGNDVRSLEVATTKAYYQNYSYDELGNILTLSHVGETSVWTRNFVYDQRDDNNLLDGIDVSSTSYTFEYDACGNQILQNADRHMQWDYANRLRAFYIQATPSSEPSKYAQYLYDAGGKRTMKIVRCQGGNYSVRLYISEGFEVFYKVEGTTNMGVQNELSVMDDTRRIATIRLGEAYSDDTDPIKYCHADQVESSMLQTSTSGAALKREEYYPFGETSFGSYAKKRYRFSGKEKDEESGMYYYGARYYVAWTCRWASVDPMTDERNFVTSYNYVQNNPLNKVDPNGTVDDWVMEANGTIKWDKKATSQATTKKGETYLGKTLTFTFNSFISPAEWDGPDFLGIKYLGNWKIDPTGDKLTSVITLEAVTDSSGNLINILNEPVDTELGYTPVGTPRDYYPGKGGKNNREVVFRNFEKTTVNKSFKLIYEHHTSVSPEEELGLNHLGFKIVDVAQLLELEYNSSTGILTVQAYTDIFPSATLDVNG